MKTQVLALCALALTIASSNAFATKEVGNGGSIIQVGDKKYDLADLHFKAIDSTRYQFDDRLTAELNAQHDALSRLQLSIENNSYRGPFQRNENELFKDQIFSSLVEYRFVATLPSDCKFIPLVNLPYNSNPISIACTEGSITYILPQYFQKLNLVQQGLLIVHERLHAIAPDQPYEIKTDVVRALNILRTVIQPAIDQKNWAFTLSQDQLAILNRLAMRVSQLSGQQEKAVRFNRNGVALLGNSEIKSSDAKVSVGTILLDSQIQGSGMQIINSTLTNSTVDGSQIQISNSNFDQVHMHAKNLSIDDSNVQKIDQIQGSRILIDHSTLDGWPSVHNLTDVRNLVIQHSEITGCDLQNLNRVMIRNSTLSNFSYCEIHQSQNVRIDHSQFEDLRVKGNNISIENSTNYTHGYANLDNTNTFGTIKGNLISLKNVKIKAGLSSFGVTGNDITLQDSTIDAWVFQGDHLKITSSYFKGYLTHESTFDVDVIVGGSIQGSDLSLDHVTMSTAAAESDFPLVTEVNVVGPTSMSNVGDFHIPVSKLKLGNPGHNVSLDGHGLRYTFEKSFWGGDPEIQSQQDLDDHRVQ